MRPMSCGVCRQSSCGGSRLGLNPAAVVVGVVKQGEWSCSIVFQWYGCSCDSSRRRRVDVGIEPEGRESSVRRAVSSIGEAETKTFAAAIGVSRDL